MKLMTKLNNMKRYIVILTAIALACPILAQETNEEINRDVVVEREYIPEIEESNKVNTIPKITEEKVEKAKINYNIATFPTMETNYNLRPIPVSELSKIKKKEYVNKGFARVGAGYPLNLLGDFYYPLLQSNSYILGIDLHHRSTWLNNVRFYNKGDRAQATVMNNDGMLNFKKSFTDNILFSEIKVTNDYFHYYGKDGLVRVGNTLPSYKLNDEVMAVRGDSITTKNNFMGVDFEIGLKSKPEYEKIEYSVLAEYNFFSQQTGANEHAFELKADISKEVLDDFSVGGEMAIEGNFYKFNSHKFSDSRYFFDASIEDSINHMKLELLPYIKYSHSIFDLYAGADFELEFAKKTHFVVSPKVRFDMSVVKNLFYLYAQVWGGVTKNSMRNIAQENLYVTPNIRIEDTYNPLNLGLGFKVRIVPKLIFDAFVDYKIIKDQYFYTNAPVLSATNTYLNTFDVVYSDAKVFDASASLTYDWSEKVTAFVKGAYHKWNCKEIDYAWYKPEYDVEAGVSYRVIRDFELSLSYNLLGNRRYETPEGTAEKMRALHDLRFNATYDISPNVSVFAECHNMTGAQYELWYGYPAMRFNCLAGFIFVF